jgi:hypothetical protein
LPAIANEFRVRFLSCPPVENRRQVDCSGFIPAVPVGVASRILVIAAGNVVALFK